MEIRSNETVDNALIPRQQQRRATAASSKEPVASPNPVDATSVTQRLQKELMSLMMSGGEVGVSAFPEGESIFTWIGAIEGGKGTMTSGLLLMIAEPFFCPFKVYSENLTLRVPLTAMLQHFGAIKKITEKWSRNSISLEKHLRADG